MSACNAQQQGDEMACGRCGLRWEVNDPNPPACLQHERRSRPRSEAAAAVSKAFQDFAVHGERSPVSVSVAGRVRENLSLADYGHTEKVGTLEQCIAAHEAADPLATLPPPPGELDVEAVGWAYRKLLAFGVGAVNEESALMMDRLNLMLLGA